MGMRFDFTSESVTEGHPDKVCDQISDAILDAHLARDPRSRVAVETLAKGNAVILAGEITSKATVNYDKVVRDVVREIGYGYPDDTDEVTYADRFNAQQLVITNLLTAQAGEIANKIVGKDKVSAGDQGLMFGYASNETEELMPLPILLAHQLAEGLAKDRRGDHPWLGPDGKTQVTVAYEDGKPVAVQRLLVSTQHDKDKEKDVEAYVREVLAPRVLGDRLHEEIKFTVNPGGSFVQGGPSADAGLTGRKIIVDTYGGMGRHGGGAFSGKDPSKVDRSAAYFARYVARQVVKEGLAERVEVQVAYAISADEAFSLYVNTFGTGDDQAAEAFVKKQFDFSPEAIIQKLELRRPIYRKTAAYGHFGRPEFSWEQ